MSSSNKVALEKLCKKHNHVLHITSHIHRYLSSVFAKNSTRKAKQSVAFGLLLLAGILTTPVSAQTVNICDRTPQVESAILLEISATNCATVTATQLDAITVLSLRRDGITTLQSGDFDDLTNLSALSLFDNSLSALPADIFNDLARLTELNLESNNLNTLPAGVFNNLTSLTSLSLRNNSLTALPAGIFNNLTSLTFLSLFDNDLSALPADIFNDLARLTELILFDNNLNTLPADVFDNLTSLTGLSLDDNNLSALPAGVFDNLTNLTSLGLSGNSLSILPAGVFDNLMNLEFLFLGYSSSSSDDISSNSLSALPAGIFDNLMNLNTLDLTANNLSALPAGIFDNLTSLTLLELHGNNLSALPAGVFDNLMNLGSLILGGNKLNTLPAGVFDNLTSLTVLDLESNNLNTLPDGVFDNLTSLESLLLNDNSLTALEVGIFSMLTNLARLSLDDNPFTTPLPADIFDPVSGADIIIDLSPIGDLDDVALSVGGTTTINVANAFISRDFDGNDRTLSYTLTPPNSAVATAMESSGVVTITGAGMGTTTVSVTADDDSGGSRANVARNIAVTVVATGILAFDEATGDTLATPIAAENGGTDTFYVQLASAPARDVVMSVTSSNTNEGTVSLGTLTFTTSDWDTRQLITVTAVDDNIDRDDTFTVDFVVTTGDGGAYPTTLAIPSVMVAITDDDTVGIDGYDALTAGNEVNAITTSEAGGAVTTYVELTSQPTGTVTVEITGLDTTEHTLTAPASGTLTFDSTNWNTPRQAITITGVDDNIVDGDQTYTLTLTATGGGYDGVVETGLVTNTDDDTAALTIADTTVNEGDGTATVTVTLSPMVTATGDITVDLTTTDATAAGADYTAFTSETLTFAMGETSKTLNIPINDDIIVEGDETFTVMLGNLVTPTGVTTVSITDDTATVTITDNDVTPTAIALSISQSTIAETAGATTITVTATLGDGNVALLTPTTVTVSVGGGTATSGTDYVTVPDFTLTILAESANGTGTFTIDPTDDTVDDSGETITISGTSGSFTITSATLTIVEAGISVHDAMTLGSQISTATITEAGSDTLYVQLASPPAGNVTLSLTSSDIGEGTVTPPTLTFTDTDWSMRQPLTVTAVDDNVDRDGDSFMVNFAVTGGGDGDNYTNSLDLPSVSVTVIDNDVASDTIALTVSPDRVTETAGETLLTVTATLNGAASATETAVEVIVSGGTASPGTDYTLSVPASTLTLPTSTLTLPTATLITIMIPAEMTSSNGVFAVIPIADDEDDNEETLTISGAASINSNTVRVNAATLTIIEFSEEEQQVIEQTVAAQASSITQVVSENIGSFLASRTSAPASAPAPPAPDGDGGGGSSRENFTSIDWQDWQHRFAKLAYEGLKRLDSDADMSLDWALKAAGGDGRLLMPLGVESLTLWAAGGRLKTKGDGMGEYDGGVNSFVVGVDTNLINNWLLGIAASYSDSQVDYTMDGNPIGATEQNLFSVHPFLSHSLPEHGLTLWVTGGYGVGDIDFSHTTNGEAASDVTQWMAAGGIEKHIITNTLWQGALRLKGLWGNAVVDATEYGNGVGIRKVESTFWRARMESEVGYHFQLPGANVRPYALIGGRWDHNDAIVSGDEWHIDIGGGVEVLSGNAFALNISVHTQLTDGDTEEDSIIGTGSFTYDIGHDRQGLQITLSRPLNNTSPSWDQHSFNEVTDTVSGINSAPLTSELAYGWTVRPFGLEGALQTYVQNSFDSHDRHYAVGLELAVNALTLNFETGYHDHTSLDSETDGSGLESMLKTKIRW